MIVFASGDQVACSAPGMLLLRITRCVICRRLLPSGSMVNSWYSPCTFAWKTMLFARSDPLDPNSAASAATASSATAPSISTSLGAFTEDLRLVRR